MTRRLFQGVLALGLAASLWLAHGPTLMAHARASAQPLLFNDDARAQIPPFLHWRDPRLFVDDYVVDYYLACLPIAYRALYELGARVADPMTISKILPYVLLAVLLAGVALAAGRLAGAAGAWSACALVLSSGVYLTRMGGGLPRSFAFPLVACAAAAITWGRPHRMQRRCVTCVTRSGSRTCCSTSGI